MTSLVPKSPRPIVIASPKEKFETIIGVDGAVASSSSTDKTSKTTQPGDQHLAGSKLTVNLNGKEFVISPLLQEALGIDDKGKCIRHPTCPVLCFNKVGTNATGAGTFKIMPCRVCYTEEKATGIRQGNAFSAVVEQLRTMSAATNPSISDDVSNLNNSINVFESDLDQSYGNGFDGNTSNAFANHIAQTTVVMESVMKRIAQVHNWTLRLKDKEILSLQLHVNSLEQQLVSEQKAYAEQKDVIKALRKTIQQDLKVIKTMATTQKHREDIEATEAAATNFSVKVVETQLANNSGSFLNLSSSTTAPETSAEGFSIMKMASLTNDSSHSQVRYFSPSKAHSPPVSPNENASTKGRPVVKSMAKQARMLQRMQSTRSIDQPILEIHDDEDMERSTPAFDITIDTSKVDCEESEPLDENVDDDDSEEVEEDNKVFSTGTYWKDDMRSLKSSAIFQSFRGGLLDIPKSPPKARHDLDDDDEGGNKNNRNSRRKKLQLNTTVVDALRIPKRGVISRTNSCEEGLPLKVLQAAANGVDMPSYFKQQSQLNQQQLYPQTPHTFNFDVSLDTPSTTTSDNKSGAGMGNVAFNNDTSLESLAMRLSQLPLSAQTNASSLKADATVQQHPNMPAMSPLQTSFTSPYSVTKCGSIDNGVSPLQTPSADSSDAGRTEKSVRKIPSLLDTSVHNNESKNKVSKDADVSPEKMSSDKKLVYSVKDVESQDKFGDEGKYTGDLLVNEGLPHGKGTMKYESGRVYDGDWICGQWHGNGKLLNPNGDIYSGEFFFDSRHGHGTYKWDNGDLYVGSFVSDKRHGKGKFSFHNGNAYTGDFCDGMFEGFGQYDFHGGHYVGEWKSGRYDGSGELVYATGGKYTGEFRNSVAHGFGTEVSTDGSIRRGIWTLGKPTE